MVITSIQEEKENISIIIRSIIAIHRALALRCKKHTTSGMSRPRAATSVHNKMPFSALQKSKKVEVRFCCFCFPWISRQSTWMYLRSSEWYFTELHEEKKTITFFDRFLFKKEYKRMNLLALGTTQYPCCSPSLVTYKVQNLMRLWKWRCKKQNTLQLKIPTIHYLCPPIIHVNVNRCCLKW